MNILYIQIDVTIYLYIQVSGKIYLYIQVNGKIYLYIQVNIFTFQFDIYGTQILNYRIEQYEKENCKKDSCSSGQYAQYLEGGGSFLPYKGL